jgi:hypothetical protein
VNTARNCPNRTSPKPSYTVMISNVMTTLHSYNGSYSLFLQLTDWDRKVWRDPMICIVDDNDFVRESLRDLIESLGYDVAVFESGERFLEGLPICKCRVSRASTCKIDSSPMATASPSSDFGGRTRLRRAAGDISDDTDRYGGP